jgi:hypothetical protein
VLTGVQEPSAWSRHYQLALTEVNDQIRESDEAAAELAQNMWNIVLKERVLAEEEEKQRRAEADSLAGQD